MMSTAKTVPFIILILFFVRCKDNEKAKLILPIPTQWHTKVNEFSLDLGYEGTEYFYNSPKIADKNSEYYHTFIATWAMETPPNVSVKNLESVLTPYGRGLINQSIYTLSYTDPIIKSFVEKVNDNLYLGKIVFIDPLQKGAQEHLNMMITYHECTEKGSVHLIVLSSPKQINHTIWHKMKSITDSSTCD